MLKSSGAVAAATMTSRILGLAREMVYAWFMGTSWVAGAFLLAFMIPNLFRRLLGEGALTAAFIPIFKAKEKQETEKAMWQSANAVLSGVVVVLAGLIILAILIVTGLLLAQAFTAKTDLMLRLLRVMFPYVLLVCVAALFMGMLNARGHFFVPAMGSALLNVVLIASVLWIAPYLGPRPEQQVFGLAIGVLIAGVAQALFQWPLLRGEGYRAQWISPWADPTVRQVMRQMIPGTIGVAAYQINVLVTNGIAWFVDAEIVASFNYAVRLMELPQGVFGLSMATYLLPTLAGLAAEKKYPEFRSTLRDGLGYLVCLNLLASVLLLVMAEPIMRLLFERGEFDAEATVRCSAALAALAPGLVAFSTVNILARAFYSVGDVRTPMKISVFCLILNVILVALMIWRWREIGLGVANATTAFINAGLLLFVLRRRLATLDMGELWRNLPGMLGATVAAGLVARAGWKWWQSKIGHETLLERLGEVFLPMVAAALVYFAICLWMKIPYTYNVLHMIRSRRGPGQE